MLNCDPETDRAPYVVIAWRLIWLPVFFIFYAPSVLAYAICYGISAARRFIK